MIPAVFGRGVTCPSVCELWVVSSRTRSRNEVPLSRMVAGLGVRGGDGGEELRHLGRLEQLFGMKRSQMRWFSHPITTAREHNEVQWEEKELRNTLLSGRKWMNGEDKGHIIFQSAPLMKRKHRIIYMFCDVNNSSITLYDLIWRHSYCAACAFCRLCPFCLCSCTGGVLLVNAK